MIKHTIKNEIEVYPEYFPENISSLLNKYLHNLKIIYNKIILSKNIKELEENKDFQDKINKFYVSDILQVLNQLDKPIREYINYFLCLVDNFHKILASLLPFKKFFDKLSI